MFLLPAHRTKHVPTLAHPLLGLDFALAQSDDGHSTGTALWLGAQVLSLYLIDHHRPRLPARRPRAVELGSGVGLTALVLGALGYDVLATDTRHVCDSVLKHNVAANLPRLPTTAGSVQVRELDWNVECDNQRVTDLLDRPFDLIVSSDTLYDPSLVQPFFRTVLALAAASREIEPSTSPLLLLALERRDPQLIDRALGCAPVPLTRVRTNQVRKALGRAGIRWDRSEWEGVEIWKGLL